MGTPAQLAQQALDYYHATTVSRPQWEQNVKRGIYNPPDGSKTNWGMGDAALAAIINPTPPPTSTYLMVVDAGGSYQKDYPSIFQTLPGANSLYVDVMDPGTISALKAAGKSCMAQCGTYQFNGNSLNFSLSNSQLLAAAQAAEAAGDVAWLMLADEPIGTQYAASVKARNQFLKDNGCTLKTCVTYYDKFTVPAWTPDVVDGVFLDIYACAPSVDFDMSILTATGAAAAAAGITYGAFLGAWGPNSGFASAGLPTQAQMTAAIQAWGSPALGFGLWAWGPSGNNWANNPSIIAAVNEAFPA